MTTIHAELLEALILRVLPEHGYVPITAEGVEDHLHGRATLIEITEALGKMRVAGFVDARWDGWCWCHSRPERDPIGDAALDRLWDDAERMP